MIYRVVAEKLLILGYATLATHSRLWTMQFQLCYSLEENKQVGSESE
jgi:hypothetical protein